MVAKINVNEANLSLPNDTFYPFFYPLLFFKEKP